MGSSVRCCLIANPVSGAGRAVRSAERVAALLAAQGVETGLVRTEKAGDAGAHAARAADGCAKIVVFGGDGTLNEVLNALPHFRTPLALVPHGTANLLGRELHLPRAPHAVVRLLTQNRVRWLDLGVANGQRFLVVGGVGFDGEVTSVVRGQRRGSLSMLDYVKPVIDVFRRWQAPELHVSLDGESLPGVTSFAVVSNVRNYAGLFSLTPDASPEDGFLNVCLLRGRARKDLVRLYVGGLFHRPPGDGIAEEHLAREIRIDAPVPVPYQIDGDPAGTTPVTFTMQSRAVPVLVP